MLRRRPGALVSVLVALVLVAAGGCATPAAAPPDPVATPGPDPVASPAPETARPAGLYAEINTNKGRIVARLEPDKTPMTVANFVGLAEGTIDNEAFDPGVPYFDGSVFHRVVPGHVIQAGAPDPDRSDARGPGYTFPNEIHADLSHDHAGALGMANGGPHTNSAQFYITLDDRSYLDGDYIVFGDVIEGMEVVAGIVQGDVIESIRIIRSGARAEAFHPDTAIFQQHVSEAETRVETAAAEEEELFLVYISQTLPGATPGANGSRYVISRSGEGDAVRDGERISVRYAGKALRYRGHLLGARGPLFIGIPFVGSAEDGSPEFAISLPPSEFSYEVGSGSLTRGFDEAIREMRRGEQRVVVVPSEMAYGRSGHYGPNRPGEPRFVISPNTMLIYAIEILDR